MPFSIVIGPISVTPLAKRYALNLVCSAKLRYFFDSQCEKTENFMILPVFSHFFSLFFVVFLPFTLSLIARNLNVRLHLLARGVHFSYISPPLYTLFIYIGELQSTSIFPSIFSNHPRAIYPSFLFLPQRY